MRRHPLRTAALAWIALSAAVAPAARATDSSVRECPPGQVFSGTRCEYQDLCNGKPYHPGDVCGGEKPVPAPTPAPAPPPPPPVRVAPAPPLRPQPPKPDCQGLIVGVPASAAARREGAAGGKDEVRRLVLNGGEAPALFEKYLDAIRGQSIARDLETLTVTFFENGRQVDLVLKKGFAEIIRGDSTDAIWVHRLKGHAAERMAGIKATAQELHADLMCGN